MHRSLAALVTLTIAACGAPATRPGARSPATQPARSVALDPLRIDVGSDGKPSHAYDAHSLLDEGNDALMQRKYDDALAAYDHLIADFADSPLVAAALFNAGLALEGKGDWAGAAARYTRLEQVAPAGSKDLLDGQFHLAAVLAEDGKYKESIVALEQILARADLEPPLRLEALARLGYGLIETKDYAGAEEILRKTIAYHREIQGTTRLESTYYAAMAQYYLAEIPHQQFLAIPLRYPEEQMLRDVDQKSELLLLARDRYVQTVDLKDPYWATAAIYEIGAIYKEFWDEWMQVPVPANFNAEEAKEYVKQVNAEPQLRKLLEKALLFHERNVSLARTENIHTIWTEQSDHDADTIRDLIARQQRGEFVTPGAPASAPGPTSAPSVAPSAPHAAVTYLQGSGVLP